MSKVLLVNYYIAEISPPYAMLLKQNLLVMHIGKRA